MRAAKASAGSWLGRWAWRSPWLLGATGVFGCSQEWCGARGLGSHACGAGLVLTPRPVSHPVRSM